MKRAATRSAPCRTFSSADRDALVELTHRFPVELAYVVDDAGDEIIGLVPAGDDVHGFAIAYPVQEGFGAADERSRLLGTFGTVEELCSALAQHLRTLWTPRLLH